MPSTLRIGRLETVILRPETALSPWKQTVIAVACDATGKLTRRV